MNYIIGIVTPRRRFNDDLGTVILMRVNILKDFFTEVALTPIKDDLSENFIWHGQYY